MLFSYISSCHLWLFLHWLGYGQIAGTFKGAGKTNESKKRYEQWCNLASELQGSIWQTYLRFGEVLKLVLNQWLFPPTL